MREVYVYDIEQFSNCHTCTFTLISSEQTYRFVIHHSRDERKEYYDFLTTKVKGLIGYNNLAFDYPVIHHFLMLMENMPNIPASQLVQLLYMKSQEVIQSDYPNIPYNEVRIPQMDLYKIWHFDNDARRTSLKDLEFHMKMPNLMDLPFSHEHKVTEEQIADVLEYNENDVVATKKFYNITVKQGKIQLRKDLKRIYGRDFLNYSDVKIGETINKIVYEKNTKLKWRDYKDKRTYRKTIDANECIPNTISFQTDNLQRFLKGLRSKKLTLEKSDFDYHVTIGKKIYKFAKGGLHSVDKPNIFEADENTYIKEVDVASMYPALLINYKYYPKHLGKTWLKGYTEIFNKRLDAKAEGNSVIADAFKLSLNGGGC